MQTKDLNKIDLHEIGVKDQIEIQGGSWYGDAWNVVKKTAAVVVAVVAVVKAVQS